jgi:hypothetical protein
MKIYLSIVISGFLFSVLACSSPEKPVPVPVTPILKPQVDPAVENTVGFFMDNWSPKNWTSPTSFVETAVPISTNATVTIDYANVITKIPTTIYGNNANLWSGKMVTDTKLVSDLTNLKTNIIRFPGGSISDVYFWNAASNPSNVPSTMVNSDGTTVASNFWYGKNDANWTISLDNYYQLLQATTSKGLITVNYGYARYGTGTNPVQDAAKLAADWVKYDNGRTQYWEIGNENFGDWEAGYRINTALNKDGQPEFLTGELYAQHFKIIAAAMREAAKSVGNTNIKIGAVLFESKPESWMSTNNKTWNDKLLPTILEEADYYVLHSYFTAIANVDAATILETPKARINEFVNYVKTDLTTKNRQIKPFALDEWNIFAKDSKQQVSHINGLHSVLLLGELLKNKMGLAARWDLFNGWSNGDDHGLFSNDDEPNIPKGNPRPAFYQMFYFQKNMGDRLIDATTEKLGNYEVYASSFSDGKVGITFVNKATTAITIKIKLINFLTGKRMYWYTLVGDTDNGEFSRKVIINGTGPTLEAGGPSNYETIKPYSSTTANGTNVTLPARSSVFVVIEKQ